MRRPVNRRSKGITQPAAISQKWLRNRTFDLPFLFLIPAVALAVSYAVNANPGLFNLVMFFNLWLLGYHHVISTYTRIAFSFKSVREHQFMVFYLPIIVLACVLLLTVTVGGWVIATTYLYWQWFHYTRQSYGISRFYMAKSGTITQPWRDINTYALYLLPLTGILYRSYQSPEKFLFLELKTLPVAYEVVQLLLAASVIAIALQILQWVRQFRQGTLSLPYVGYMLTHYAVFGTGYLFIEDINYGWLALNIWHNAQYIGFVWMYNNRRFKDGIDPEQKLVSTISQDGKFWMYILVCLFVTLGFYSLMQIIQVTSQIYTVLPMTVVIYMTINFHHYVVDAVIWKKKKTVSS